RLMEAGYSTTRSRRPTGSAVYAVLIERVPTAHEGKTIATALREQGLGEAVIVSTDPLVLRVGGPLPLRGAVELAERVRAAGHQGAGVGARRGITFRTEDFVLLVIGFSWLAKTAVNKELNLIARTPLNWPILLYVATTLAATLLGSLTGTINSWSGYFHVLKYVEYFVIYYMAVNNLRDREHGWRLVGAAFITAAIVSVIGLAQVPSGERVSAPFEGEIGEPNT